MAWDDSNGWFVPLNVYQNPDGLTLSLKNMIEKSTLKLEALSQYIYCKYNQIHEMREGSSSGSIRGTQKC